MLLTVKLDEGVLGQRMQTPLAGEKVRKHSTWSLEGA